MFFNSLSSIYWMQEKRKGKRVIMENIPNLTYDLKLILFY